MQATEFETFGAPHIVTMALTLVLPIVLAVAARRAASRAVGATISYLLASMLLINEVTHWGYRLAEVGWSRFVENHLPLHACGIAVLATAATLLFRSQRAYEIAFFWGVVGSSNAVITPGWQAGDFPDYHFFQYFISHSGIVAGALFATWGLKMRPTLGGMFRSFAFLNLFALGIAFFNLIFDSNYMYLSGPPSGTISPFFFAPWPWYLPILEVIGLALFFVILSPFLVTQWRPFREAVGPLGRTNDAVLSRVRRALSDD